MRCNHPPSSPSAGPSRSKHQRAVVSSNRSCAHSTTTNTPPGAAPLRRGRGRRPGRRRGAWTWTPRSRPRAASSSWFSNCIRPIRQARRRLRVDPDRVVTGGAHRGDESAERPAPDLDDLGGRARADAPATNGQAAASQTLVVAGRPAVIVIVGGFRHDRSHRPYCKLVAIERSESAPPFTRGPPP